AVRDEGIAHHGLEEPVLHLLFQRGRDLGAVLLLELRLLARPGLAGLLNGDLLPPGLRSIARAGHAEIDDAVGAPGGKNHRQGPEYDVGQPFPFYEAVSDRLEHLPLGSVRWARLGD